MRIIFLAFLSLLYSCGSAQPEREPVRYPKESPKITTIEPKEKDIVAQMLASEMGVDLVTQIQFDAGSSRLSEEAREKLRELYEKARSRERPIEEVRLVTWSDEDLPTEDEDELPEWQKKLARKRNDAIERALMELDKDLEVRKISMAEKTEGLEGLFFPVADETKESMEDPTMPSRASHSIILFVLEEA